jgi:Fission yeast centromere protein N-terminal domain
MTFSSSPPRPAPFKKRRRAITDAEKLNIRNYYFKKSLESKPSLDTVQRWFKNKYDGHVLTYLILSEIFSF